MKSINWLGVLTCYALTFIILFVWLPPYINNLFEVEPKKSSGTWVSEWWMNFHFEWSLGNCIGIFLLACALAFGYVIYTSSKQNN